MVEFCREHGGPFQVCGKVIVATSQEELPRLQELLERGRANGVGGLRMLGLEELREIELACHRSGSTACARNRRHGLCESLREICGIARPAGRRGTDFDESRRNRVSGWRGRDRNHRRGLNCAFGD